MDSSAADAANSGLRDAHTMQTMPVAVARRQDPELRASEARALSAVTHAHPVCLDACVVYCDIAAPLVDATPVDAAVDGALER